MLSNATRKKKTKRAMFRTQPRSVTVPIPGPIRYHEVFGTTGPDDVANLASVRSLETYLPLWNRIKSKGEAGVRITGEPFTWTDDGTTFFSSCVAFDCNMWAAHRATVGYNAATRAIDLGASTTIIGTQVRPAVEAINFLLEGGALARDRSIADAVDLTPSSLKQEHLKGMRNALIAIAWKTSADTYRDSSLASEQAVRAAWLTKSVEAAEKAPNLIPKAWAYSRKVEAVAANGDTHALKCNVNPDVNECRMAIGAYASAIAGIGLGFSNYSDVKKTDVIKKLQTAQNDLTLVYGIAKEKARTEVSTIQRQSTMERALARVCSESANLEVEPFPWMSDTALGSYKIM